MHVKQLLEHGSAKMFALSAAHGLDAQEQMNIFGVVHFRSSMANKKRNVRGKDVTAQFIVVEPPANLIAKPDDFGVVGLDFKPFGKGGMDYNAVLREAQEVIALQQEGKSPTYHIFGWRRVFASGRVKMDTETLYPILSLSEMMEFIDEIFTVCLYGTWKFNLRSCEKLWVLVTL